MPSKVIAAVVAAGAASAVLFGTMLSGGLNAVLLAYFAQLPLFIVGLSFGWPAAALAGGLGSAGMLFVGGLSIAAVFAAINAAPVALLCQRALRHRETPGGATEWYPPGRIAGDATLMALAVAVVQTLILASLTDGPQSFLRGRLEQGAVPGSPEDEAMRDFVHVLGRILPGLAAASWLWMLTINGAIGQWVARRAGTAWRPSPRMADLELPSWMTGLFALAVVGSLLPGFSGMLGENAVIVLLAAYTLAGLAIVHAAATQWTNPAMGLAAVYLASLMLGAPLVAIAAAGVIEPWMKLRARLLARGGPKTGGGPQS